MSQLMISGAVIRTVSIKNKAPKQVEMAVEADWSEQFCREIGITTPSDKYKDSGLNLGLNMANFIFTPNDEGLRKHEIDVNCSQSKDFKYVPRLTKKGTIKSRELHFKIVAGGPGVAGKIENCLDHIGDHPGTMKLVYNEQTQAEEPAEEESDQIELGADDDIQDAETSGDGPKLVKKRGRKAKK